MTDICAGRARYPGTWGLPLLVAALIVPQVLFAAEAADFAALVSPPRFEMRGKPGEKVRDVVQIGNTGNGVAEYVLRTADWDINPQGGVIVHPEALQPGSCRPWVRIERLRVKLPPNGRKNYRFEVQIPPDAPSGECRFALLIALPPETDIFAETGDIRFPIAGQVAVVVYVAVGDAKPALEFKEVRLEEVNGRQTPVAVFHNAGNAHGRPAGLLEAEDANGQLLDLVVSPSPILPGETRAIPLWPADIENTQKAVEFKVPMKLKGPIEWDGGSVNIDTVLQ
ncbi:MAG: hypothetical protein L0Z68_01155 [Gammaproteobacteria bacterium]|nr:hypothetical protein [Gammaproteobacteria bacterium]